jgi:hypothetical protein
VRNLLARPVVIFRGHGRPPVACLIGFVEAVASANRAG